MPVERSKFTLEIWNSWTISWEKFCCVPPSTESLMRAPSTAMRVRSGSAAQNGNVHRAVVIALVVGGDRDARREEGKLQKAAAVERELLDLLAADDLIDGVRFELDLRVDRCHRDGLFLFPHLQAWIHRGDAAGRDHGCHRIAGEAGSFHTHLIGSGGQRRHAVLTVLVAQQDAFESRSRVLHFDRGVGYRSAGRIVHRAGDFAGGRLRPQDRHENHRQQHPQITSHLDIQTQ